MIIPFLASVVLPFVQDAVKTLFDNQKQNKALKIEKEAEEKTKIQEKEIWELKLKCHEAGIDLKKEEKNIADTHANVEITKSINSLEQAILEIRKAEINAPNVEYIPPLQYFERGYPWHIHQHVGVAIANFFILLVNLFCHLITCSTNCFKTIPLFLITLLTGLPIAYMMYAVIKDPSIIKMLAIIKEGDIIYGNFVISYFELYQMIVGYFTGRKILSNVKEQEQKKKVLTNEKAQNNNSSLVIETAVGKETEKVPINSVPIDKTLTDVGFQYTKPKRNVIQCFIHCSASSNPKHDNIQTIQDWHLARGFNEVGYHYFIRKDGTLEIGRSLEKIPASQKESIVRNNIKIGGNTGTIAICLHGGGGTPPVNDFTEAQYNTLRNLCNQINSAYNGSITFHGHCEVANKACPVFDYKKILGLVNGKMV